MSLFGSVSLEGFASNKAAARSPWNVSNINISMQPILVLHEMAMVCQDCLHSLWPMLTSDLISGSFLTGK